MEIKRAELEHLDDLLVQFNSYRAFYAVSFLPGEAREFIRKNIENNRSIIFVAIDDSGRVVGFTQLYERISSLSMSTYMYVSDLFVDSELRGSGIARKLMERATEHAVERGASSIQLETAHTNTVAQKLYETLGYEHDLEYRTYVLDLRAKRALESSNTVSATAR